MSSNTKKIICIIQARMSSKRLPGKMMIKLSGKSCIAHATIARTVRCIASAAVTEHSRRSPRLELPLRRAELAYRTRARQPNTIDMRK